MILAHSLNQGKKKKISWKPLVVGQLLDTEKLLQAFSCWEKLSNETNKAE